jgi:hypothetical protein
MRAETFAMSALADLSEEEKYLYAILMDQSGIDPAEFSWTDDTSDDFVFRCWDYQYPWYRTRAKFQIDQCARAIGKSVGIQMRAWAFAFTNPGQEMLITAPELIHLDPVTQAIENRIVGSRLSREFLKQGGTSKGFSHRPFEARFRNGARILGRIPQKDGKGVKGSVAAGTLVTTPDGHIPIEQISEGDLVLTGEGRFMPVTRVYAYRSNVVAVAGAGHRGLLVSENHRFRARRNRNPQRARNLQRPTWMPVYDEEHVRYYWGAPVTLPEVSRPVLPRDVVEESSFFWLAGRYVADGNQQGPAIRITAHRDRIQEVASVATLAGYDPKPVAHDNAAAVVIYRTDLAEWLLRNFGEHADGKRLPIWLHSEPRSVKEAFLDGYLTGDGHWNEARQRWEIPTASKELAIGLRLLGLSLGYTTSFSWVDPEPNAMCATPLRSYRVHFSKNGHALIEDGVAWQKIRSIEPAGRALVYDLVVAGDGSYVGDGLIHRGGI